MSFKMKCPKCESVSYSVERDTRTYATGKAGELVFSCRCGKQLFGDQLTAEYDRQKAAWEADPARRAAAAERESRLREEEARQEALRQAFEYRRAWVAQKRAGSGAPPPPLPIPRPPPPRALARAPAADVRRTTADPRGNRAGGVQTLGTGLAAPNRAEPVRRQASGQGSAAQPAAEAESTHCEWAGCPNPPAPNSKYCSRACSNKNARLRHARRKKGSQEVAA
jgi:hypothetical protein